MSFPILDQQNVRVDAARSHAIAVNVLYNAMAVTYGVTQNALMFPVTITTRYHRVTMPGTAMLVVLTCSPTRSSLNQLGTCLIIRPLQSLTFLNPMLIVDYKTSIAVQGVTIRNNRRGG